MPTDEQLLEPTPAELAKLAEAVYRLGVLYMQGLTKRNVPPLGRIEQALVLVQAMHLVAAHVDLSIDSMPLSLRARLALIAEAGAKSIGLEQTERKADG